MSGYPFCPECGCDWSDHDACPNPDCVNYESVTRKNIESEEVDEGGEG